MDHCWHCIIFNMLRSHYQEFEESEGDQGNDDDDDDDDENEPIIVWT